MQKQLTPLQQNLSQQLLLRDAIGTEHQIVPKNESARIVSLVPSITELLCDLGLQDQLVGRTGFCIHPREIVKAIPKIGGTKDVNIEKIRRLAPTHLIVNIDENEKPTVEQLAQFVPHVIVTHPLQASDNFDLFRLLGGVFNVAARAEELCQALQQQFDLLPAPEQTKKVLYCIWKDPWMTVSQDTYIANLLKLRGWQQWQADSALRYPSFDWSDASLQDVELVLLSTEPYSFTQAHAEALQQQIHKPVLLVDGEMLSWYGSRSIQGLSYLANLSV
ncbi:helical backbone metal receptor [Undibacterium flavidum]|uniref:ABC transporter substrate-binding protein n=1 Tax=Undibacterium flavidum TaxID=2762297 RepID=A0ABR6YGK9_9BURK|nr:ABC transporter substrate-binding protein [Undibacterium flavidum]